MARYSFRNTTGDHRPLDIRELHRWGVLRSSGWKTVTWKRNSKVISSIGVLPYSDRLVLRYSHESHYGERQQKEYPVSLDFTRCHYGGERRWFICPASGCSRRVAVLYSGPVFACRHCLGLRYESQREALYMRALRKAQSISMKLGGTGCTDDGLPEKPKGMHWKTYSHLTQEYENALGCSWPPFLLRALVETV